MIIDNFISAFVQVLIFALIPFVVYLIRHKSYKGFFKYIGFYKSTGKATIYGALLGLLLGSIGVLILNMTPSIKDTAIAKGTVPAIINQFKNPIEKIVMIIITGLIKTSLAEEILFRGFVAKRLISKIGYRSGNLLQSFIFGGVHIVLFWGSSNTFPFLIFAFLIPAVGGYFSGYLNERQSNGSIFPGWLIHGIGNLMAYSYLAFVG